MAGNLVFRGCLSRKNSGRYEAYNKGSYGLQFFRKSGLGVGKTFERVLESKFVLEKQIELF